MAFFFLEKRNQLISKDDKAHLWHNYSELSRGISVTFAEIEELSLKMKEYFFFFKYFEPHIEKHKERYNQKHYGREYYIQEIMPIFFRVLVKNMENDDIRNDHNIWEFFPAEWKITVKNVEKQENNFSGSYVSRVLLEEFWSWAKDRVGRKKEYDFVLDEISKKLFPNVCPIMWANILTFSVQYKGSPIKSLIEHPKNFGESGRSYAFAFKGNDKESERRMRKHQAKRQDDEEKEAIALALLLFGETFTEDNLIDYIIELKGVKFDDDTEYRWRNYFNLFKKILEEVRRRKETA